MARFGFEYHGSPLTNNIAHTKENINANTTLIMTSPPGFLPESSMTVFKLYLVALAADRIDALTLEGSDVFDLGGFAFGHVLAAELALRLLLVAFAWASVAKFATIRERENFRSHKTPCAGGLILV